MYMEPMAASTRDSEWTEITGEAQVKINKNDVLLAARHFHDKSIEITKTDGQRHLSRLPNAIACLTGQQLH